MRTIAIVLLASGVLAVAVIATMNLRGDTRGRAEAAASLVVGYDVNLTGNSATELGPIDDCISVSSASEQEFQVDVFLKGLPLEESLLVFGYEIGFPQDVVYLTAQDHLLFANAALHSSISDFSEDVPDPFVPHPVNVADFGTAEYNPPFTQGILGRYTFRVLPGAPAGVYGLTLTNVILGRDTPPGGELTVDEVWDSGSSPQYGTVAVDAACGAPPPTITATPTPAPTGTSTATAAPTATGTPAPTPTPTPAPTSIALATGWNHVCPLEAEQPVSDALTEIGSEVLALYRLRADQGYDKWFPRRPDISSIATVRPYEPLFMLMANAVQWPQDTSAAPPTALGLTEGWNSSCYAGQTKTVEAATTGIAGQFAVAYALASDQTWLRFVPDRPGISNLTELRPADALLVLVTQPGGAQWVFDP